MRNERGDAGVGLLFLLVALFVAPVAIFSDGIQDQTAEVILYCTGASIAFGLWRAVRKYLIRPIDLIATRTAHVPAIRRHMHRQERMWSETYAALGAPLPEWYVDELEREAASVAQTE